MESMKQKVPSSTDWEQKCNICGKVYTLDPTKDSYVSVYYCDMCKEKENLRIAKEEIQEKIIRAIPPKFINLATDKDELLEKCKDKSVFCYGTTGTGKTVFATCLAKDYIRRGKNVKYHSYPTLIMKLRNSYRKEDTYDRKTPWDIAEATANFNGVLVLDDLGAEKTTDFVKEITYFILNEREVNLRTTIITSNFSLDELNDTIDPRISSRIAGMCEILKFTGKDRRLKNNGQ